MSQKSSINFKPSTSFQVFHNSIVRPNYAIGGELISNRNGYEALELKEQIIENAKEAYTKNIKQKFQAKSYEWSAVVNIKSDTTMQDLERLAEHFETKYGFQCYQISIHRDEGHIDDNGEKVINYHAHLEFITLDKNTGKNCFKLRDFPKSKMREIQTEVAEILGMERGVDKRISKRERVEPRKYAQMKEQERKNTKNLKTRLENLEEENKDLNRENNDFYYKNIDLEDVIQAKNQEIQELKTKNQELEAELEQEKLSSDEVKAYIEQFRKDCIGKGLPKEFFRKISNLKQQAKPTIKELLDDTLETLLQSYLKEKERNIELENENKALKAENNEIKAQKYTLTQEQIQEIINQALAQKNAEIEKKNQEISKLQAEKEQFQELLESNPALREAYNHALEALKNRDKEKAEKFFDKNTDKIEQNQEKTTNNEIKYYSQLFDLIQDDVSTLQTPNTDKTEISKQDQTHNEDEEDLGIDKILQPRKNK